MKSLKKGLCLLLTAVIILTVMTVGIVSASAAARLLGDADNNNIVNVGDATYIQMAIARMNINGKRVDYEAMGSGSIDFKAADVDKNGMINVGDATLIQMYAAHMSQAQGYGISEPIPDEGEQAVVRIYDLEGRLTQTYSAHVGEKFTVVTTLDMSGQADGLIQAVDGRVVYTASVLRPTADPESFFEAEMFPVIREQTDLIANIGVDGENGTKMILYNATGTSKKNAYHFDSPDAVLTKVEFEVTAAGDAEVRNTLVTLALADDDTTRIVDNGVITPGKGFTSETSRVEGSTPQDPTEPSSGSSVKIYDLKGGLVKTISAKKGDKFTVITTLDMSGQEDGLVQAVDGRVSYTASVLQPTADPESFFEAEMFPVISEQTSMIVNIGVDGGNGIKMIKYNATGTSKKNAYHFDSPDAVLTKVEFEVISEGTAEIRNTLVTLALADDATTRIVDNGELVSGRDFTGHGVTVVR